MNFKFFIYSGLILILGCRSTKNTFNINFINLENAEIIISEDALPSVSLAAQELQKYIYKITNITIPISKRKSGQKNFHFFVGESHFTNQLGININTLKEDIKLVSGKDYLVLLGQDSKYVPKGPINRNYDDINLVVSQWDKITKNYFGHPHLTLFKNYSNKFDIWENESKGTLNAVYEYLHILGVRWYFPGDIGEVLPEDKKIKYPNIDISFKASFSVRDFYFYYNKYFMASDDFLMWSLRLKDENYYNTFGNEIAHGMTHVHSRDEFKRQNKEVYRLIKSQRDTNTFSYGTPCLSSNKLLDLHIYFLKMYFTTFNESTMSVMPADGFGLRCECDICSSKKWDNMGRYNSMSNYVWEYVSKVSNEVHTRLPNKKLSSFAYATYLEPPNELEKLKTNFKLGVCYPIAGKKDNLEFIYYEDLIRKWKSKLNNDSILIWDYFLYTDPKRNLSKAPVIFTGYISNEIKFLAKENSYGKFIEVYCSEPDNKIGTGVLAFDHLNIYLTSRLLWNANESAEYILNEYFELYYGPSSKDIKEIFLYIENNWRSEVSSNFNNEILKDLEKALRKTKSGSVYYKRIKVLIEYMR